MNKKTYTSGSDGSLGMAVPEDRAKAVDPEIRQTIAKLVGVLRRYQKFLARGTLDKFNLQAAISQVDKLANRVPRPSRMSVWAASQDLHSAEVALSTGNNDRVSEMLGTSINWLLVAGREMGKSMDNKTEDGMSDEAGQVTLASAQAKGQSGVVRSTLQNMKRDAERTAYDQRAEAVTAFWNKWNRKVGDFPIFQIPLIDNALDALSGQVQALGNEPEQFAGEVDRMLGPYIDRALMALRATGKSDLMGNRRFEEITPGETFEAASVASVDVKATVATYEQTEKLLDGIGIHDGWRYNSNGNVQFIERIESPEKRHAEAHLERVGARLHRIPGMRVLQAGVRPGEMGLGRERQIAWWTVYMEFRIDMPTQRSAKSAAKQDSSDILLVLRTLNRMLQDVGKSSPAELNESPIGPLLHVQRQIVGAALYRVLSRNEYTQPWYQRAEHAVMAALEAARQNDKQSALLALRQAIEEVKPMVRKILEKKRGGKSQKADELAYLLLEVAQAADSRHLMAVSRALADLRGAPIDEAMDTALRQLYTDASAAREAKDWKKVSRAAWGLVDGYMKKSVKALKLAPGMKVFVKSENCYGEIKEMDDQYCKVELFGEDGTSKGFAVMPKSSLTVRSKMAAKDYQASVATVRFLTGKLQTLVGADVYIQPSMLDELQDAIGRVLADRGLESGYIQALQKMQGDVGAALNLLWQTKEKDWKNRHAPGQVGVMARERLAEIQTQARNALKQAVGHGREVLKKRPQGTGRLGRLFGRRSALASARRKAGRVKYRPVKSRALARELLPKLKFVRSQLGQLADTIHAAGGEASRYKKAMFRLYKAAKPVLNDTMNLQRQGQTEAWDRHAPRPPLNLQAKPSERPLSKPTPLIVKVRLNASGVLEFMGKMLMGLNESPDPNNYNVWKQLVIAAADSAEAHLDWVIRDVEQYAAGTASAKRKAANQQAKLDTSRYFNSHGQQPDPNQYGMWMFDIGGQQFTATNTLKKAAQIAVEQYRQQHPKGYVRVYVLP